MTYDRKITSGSLSAWWPQETCSIRPERRCFTLESSYDSQFKRDLRLHGDSGSANGTWKWQLAAKSCVWCTGKPPEGMEGARGSRNEQGRWRSEGSLGALKQQSPLAEEGSVHESDIPGQFSGRSQFNGEAVWPLKHRNRQRHDKCNSYPSKPRPGCGSSCTEWTENIRFVHQVEYFGVILGKKITWTSQSEMTETKAFRIVTRNYSLFKCERLRANIKVNHHKAHTFGH